MSRLPKSAIFLERASYRQRRLRDAALLVPILGVVLWLIPLLWPRDTSDSPGSGVAMIYVFGVWVLLIVLTAAITRFLRQEDSVSGKDDAG